MWSGRATVWQRNPRRYVQALTGDIKKTYPQLGEIDVDYVWAGTLGNTVHRMPQIGELAPGVWLASGFGGHGLNTTAMAGNIIARAVVEGDETWRRFTPFELVWAGGILGRAAAQTRVWVKRLRDAIAERRAHAREIAHRQANDPDSMLPGSRYANEPMAEPGRFSEEPISRAPSMNEEAAPQPRPMIPQGPPRRWTRRVRAKSEPPLRAD
jgi:hypothetical protein